MGSNSKRKGYGILMLLAIMLLAMAIGLCAFASDSDEQTIVTKESADLKVTYLGNSLRMDYVDESGYTKTCMRFGYQFALPEGKEMSDYTWYWEYTTDGKEITNENVKTSSGTNYVAVEGVENTYNSNLVITNIPANYYERNFYVRLVVKDGENILTVDTVLDASIKGVADKIKVANENESDVTYAAGIITEDEAHNTKVDDLIFKGLDKGVAYASNMSKSESIQKTVIVRDDITLSAAIDIPTGADVAIKDDGTKRTLTRSEGFYDAPLFKVYGGANLTFTSTNTEQQAIDSEGNVNESITDMLVIDGNNEVVGSLMTGNSPAIIMVSENDEGTANTSETGGNVTIYSGVAFVDNTNIYNGAVVHTETNAYGTLTIHGGRFEGNVASGKRSGVFQLNNHNYANVENALFKANSAKYAGVFTLGASDTSILANACVFLNNKATDTEAEADCIGGVFTSSATGTDAFTITNSIFSGNEAPTQGVGQLAAGTLKVEDCKFVGNKATSTHAGVLYVAKDCIVNMIGCEFDGNTATTYGGVFSAKTSNITIDRCTFTSNAATTNGGVFADHEDSTGNTNITITGSTFDGNTAGDSTNTSTGGGVLYLSVADIVNISGGCEFKNNNCRQLGGAIGIRSASSVTIDNCTFEKNKTINTGTSYGGAIATDPDGQASQISIESSTLSENSSRNGGAIFIGKNSSLELKNGSVFTSNKLNTTKGAGKDCMLNGSASGLELSGKVQTEFYISTSTIKVFANITASLTEGSSVIFEWAQPTKVPDAVITFASEEIMNNSKQYISLADSLSSSYELNYISGTDSYYATLTTATAE